VAAAGDVNGDGLKDALASAGDPTNAAFLLLGGRSWPRDDVQPDLDGDGVPDACDLDIDGDGIANDHDDCRAAADADQLDTDLDRVGDACDNCPGTPNFDQADADGDGIGDACDADRDGDGVLDLLDNCPLRANADQADPDGDGRGSACDDCPAVANPDQTDGDRDGIGDACDQDWDNDGVANANDDCPLVGNVDQRDTDGDGIGDACDSCIDRDGDGYGRFGFIRSGCPFGTSFDCDDDDATIHPGAFDACDGKDNDCDGVADDAICTDFIFASTSGVDGVTLAALGRAFGQCSATPELSWWSRVEFTGDQCVDGDDLAVLSLVWGCSGSQRICR